MKISAIVLVGARINKELLKKSLDSISWCDEVVKVETDNLKGGFTEWRNIGAKRAKGDWLLYIDSDEEVTEELRKEIIQLTSKSINQSSAYAIPRRNVLLGREMKHGGWWPDFVLRLIKKDALVSWQGELHEQPKIKGQIGKLKNPLIHTSHRSLAEMIQKTNEWSEIEAKLLFKSGHPKMVWWRFISVGFREFWRRGILELGFLDGTEGIIEVIYQCYSRMITYAKLWEMQIGTK